MAVFFFFFTACSCMLKWYEKNENVRRTYRGCDFQIFSYFQICFVELLFGTIIYTVELFILCFYGIFCSAHIQLILWFHTSLCCRPCNVLLQCNGKALDFHCPASLGHCNLSNGLHKSCRMQFTHIAKFFLVSNGLTRIRIRFMFSWSHVCLVLFNLLNADLCTREQFM